MKNAIYRSLNGAGAQYLVVERKTRKKSFLVFSFLWQKSYDGGAKLLRNGFKWFKMEYIKMGGN